jgi:predicted RNA-binding protein YlqC (UPF0109 family)
MDPMEERELLTELVRALVDRPRAVQVDEERVGDESRMLISVHPHDRGKVIGKKGSTVQALRVLFGRMAAVEGRKIFIKLDEPDRRAA